METKIKYPKQLSASIYFMISDAVKSTGSFHPADTVFYFEESLTSSQLAWVEKFLLWVSEDTENRKFGSGNYKQRYQEFLESLKQESAEYPIIVGNKRIFDNTMGHMIEVEFISQSEKGIRIFAPHERKQTVITYDKVEVSEKGLVINLRTKVNTADFRKCRRCNKEYSQKEVERSLGKESSPAILGFCSAQCYTKAIVLATQPPKCGTTAYKIWGAMSHGIIERKAIEKEIGCTVHYNQWSQLKKRYGF